MIDLLIDWRNIESHLRSVEHIALFSDFDGTLTPIVERPEMAILSQGTKARFQKLSENRRFTIGIISGRSLQDLRERIGIKDLIYAGNHGLEIEGPGFTFINPVARETAAIFRVLHRLLDKSLSGIKGALIENKGLSLSVHYRCVAENDLVNVKSAVDNVTGTACDLKKIKVTTGKKVYEIRPPINWDKGKAINWLLEKFIEEKYRKNIVSLFMGDDLTDEDGFKSINRKKGISIFVGDGDTVSAATYYLRSPDEVQKFLDKLSVLRLN